MHDFCRRESVEVRGRGMGICPDIFRVDKVADLKIGQFGREGDGIEGIAGRSEDRRDLGLPLLKRQDRVIDVVEHLPGIGVVDPVVDIITGLAVADCFADNFCNHRAGICNKEPARLGKDLHVLRETAV